MKRATYFDFYRAGIIDEELKIQSHKNHLIRIKNAKSTLTGIKPVVARKSYSSCSRKRRIELDKSREAQYQNKINTNKSKRPTTTFQIKDIDFKRKAGTLNCFIRKKADDIRVKENRRFVDKLINAQPVISSKMLNKEYRRHKYLVNQITKNSYKRYHNRYFYESLGNLMSNTNIEDHHPQKISQKLSYKTINNYKSEVETTFQTNSNHKDTIISSSGVDCTEQYSNHFDLNNEPNLTTIHKKGRPNFRLYSACANNQIKIRYRDIN